MSKLRVFLSTSKHGDYKLSLYIRDLLTKSGNEVFEYTGGEYSPALMLSCDLLVMIPARTKAETKKEISYIGKGQDSEIDLWIEKKTKNSIYICSKDKDEHGFLTKFFHKYVHDKNDYKIAYSHVHASGQIYDMSPTYLAKVSMVPYNPDNPCAEVVSNKIMDCTASMNTSESSPIQIIEKPTIHLAYYRRVKK